MACSIISFSVLSLLVEWEPVGRIDGFSKGADVVKITPSDEGENKLSVSATGNFGSIYGSAQTNGELTLSFEPGAPIVGVLRDLYNKDKLRGDVSRGRMTISNTSSGQVDTLDCAFMKNIPETTMGTDVTDSVQFVFLYVSHEYSPPKNAQAAIR